MLHLNENNYTQKDKSCSCCVCMNDISDSASFNCTVCKEGALCEDCFEILIAVEDTRCPICRQPYKDAVWCLRVNKLLADYCYIGFLWIAGYIILYHVLDVNCKERIYISVLLDSWGCIIVGFIASYLSKCICSGIVRELDEIHMRPPASMNQSEENSEEGFSVYRENIQEFRFTKKIACFIVKQINFAHDMLSFDDTSSVVDKDQWSFNTTLVTLAALPTFVHLCKLVAQESN